MNETLLLHGIVTGAWAYRTMSFSGICFLPQEFDQQSVKRVRGNILVNLFLDEMDGYTRNAIFTAT